MTATIIDNNNDPFKIKQARNAVNNAIKAGKIKKPTICDKCNKPADKLEADHHKGYDQANHLNVKWLCLSCHHTKTQAPTNNDVMEETINLLTKKFELTPEGYLKGRGIITNVGVFTYRLSDGTIRRELRTPEEVFHPDSRESLKQKPVTDNHPPAAIDVNAENIKKFSRGGTGSETFNDPYALATDIIITDKDLVKKAQEKEMDSFSAGYKRDFDPTPGVWCGQEYDGVQRNIRYNHVAVVPTGRAGDLAKIILDSNEEELYIQSAAVGSDNNIIIEDIQKMSENLNLKKVVLDSIEYQAEKPVVDKMNDYKKRLDIAEKSLDKKDVDVGTMKKELDTKNKELEKLMAERDGLKDKIDNLEKDKKDAADIDKLVDEKLNLLKMAKDAGIEKTDDLTNTDIKKEIICKMSKSTKVEDLKEKSEDYINARYDAACEIVQDSINKDAQNKQSLYGDLQKRTNETVQDTVDAAKNNYVTEITNRWQGGKN